MKYMGSKNRHAKELLPIILKHRKLGQWYVEPFVGGANMIDKAEGNRIGSDLNEYVISLLLEMSKEDFISPHITESYYLNIKNNKDLHEKWLVGYAGTQLSFGSTWFGSYRKDNLKKRDYSVEAQKNVNKQSENIKGVQFIHSGYENICIPENSVIYCDPPYQTEATNGKYKDRFNHAEFWNWVRERVKDGHVVYTSEYSAPEDFISIWSKAVNQRMNNNNKTSKGTEKLFIHKSQAHLHPELITNVTI